MKVVILNDYFNIRRIILYYVFIYIVCNMFLAFKFVLWIAIIWSSQVTLGNLVSISYFRCPACPVQYKVCGEWSLMIVSVPSWCFLQGNPSGREVICDVITLQPAGNQVCGCVYLDMLRYCNVQWYWKIKLLFLLHYEVSPPFFILAIYAGEHWTNLLVDLDTFEYCSWRFWRSYP